MYKRQDRAITLLYENDGVFPAPAETHDPAAAFGFHITQETPFETRYFIVELTADQEVRGVDIDHIAAVDRQAVVESINEILSSDRPRGYANYYRYGIFHHEDGGSTIVVLDCFLQLQFAYNALRITVIVAISCACLLYTSKKVTIPLFDSLSILRQSQALPMVSFGWSSPLQQDALPSQRLSYPLIGPLVRAGQGVKAVSYTHLFPLTASPAATPTMLASAIPTLNARSG